MDVLGIAGSEVFTVAETSDTVKFWQPLTILPTHTFDSAQRQCHYRHEKQKSHSVKSHSLDSKNRR